MANHLCGDLQGTDGQGGHNLGSTNGQPDVLGTHVDGSDTVTKAKCEKQEREKNICLSLMDTLPLDYFIDFLCNVLANW